MAKKNNNKNNKIQELERQVATLQKRAYEAASTKTRVQNWKSVNADANTEISPALSILRNRSRDLRRNNPFAAKAIKIFANNVVGTGIIPASEDETLLALFLEWANSRYCDSSEKLNFYGIQQQVISTIAESGECLILKTLNKNKKFPIQLKILEPDYLDHTKTDAKKNIIQGVQFDDAGKPVIYHLFKNHPGGELASSETIEVKAEDIIHIFKEERAGQVRGTPWLSPVMIFLKKHTDLISAVLERIHVSNLLCATITDINGDPTETQENFELSPGAIITLPAGKDIVFNTPPDAGNVSEFEKSLLRAISSGLNIPYEYFTGDFSQVNFSSARMAVNSFILDIDSIRWNMFVPLFLDKVWQWFYLNAPLSGLYKSVDLEVIPFVDWTPPRRILVDAIRETPVVIEAIKAGTTTLSEVLRESGYDPKAFFAEYKKDMDLIDSLGLVLSSDYRNELKKASNQQQSKTQTA